MLKRKKIKFTAENDVQMLLDEAEPLLRRITSVATEEVCWMHQRLHVAVETLTKRFPVSPLLKQAKLLKLRFKEAKEARTRQSEANAELVAFPEAVTTTTSGLNQAA